MMAEGTSQHTVKWIKISDQMPPMRKSVLITDGKRIEIGHFFIDRDGSVMVWLQNCGTINGGWYTHWTALPSLPEEGEHA